MDRFEEIKRERPAPIYGENTPMGQVAVLHASWVWLIAEVERVRRIEESFAQAATLPDSFDNARLLRGMAIRVKADRDIRRKGKNDD